MNWYLQAQALAKKDPELQALLDAYKTAEGEDKEIMKQAILAKIPVKAPVEPKVTTAEDGWTESAAIEVTAQVTTIDSKETEALHEVTLTLPMPSCGISVAYIRGALRNRFLRPYFLKNKVSGIKALATILVDESGIMETEHKFRHHNLPREQWNQDDFQMYAFEHCITSFPKANIMSLSALRDWLEKNPHGITTTLRNESDN